ncbi:hypothetical protein LguiB_000870 [Lonicera macranthoides]
MIQRWEGFAIISKSPSCNLFSCSPSILTTINRPPPPFIIFINNQGNFVVHTKRSLFSPSKEAQKIKAGLAHPTKSTNSPHKKKMKAWLHATAYVEGDKYYGAKSTINVWEPKIQQPKEFSVSHIWVLGGSFGKDLNSIEVGWKANFKRYCTKRKGSANAIQWIL